MTGKYSYAVWFALGILAVASWFYLPTYTAAILLVLALHMILSAVYLLAQRKSRDSIPMWIFIGGLISIGMSLLTAPAFW